MKSQYPIYFHPSGCWEWIGDFNKNGYGWIYIPELKQRVVAHRYIYEQEIGPIPDGHVLDHVKERCFVGRACCNPGHLQPVSGLENTLRGDGPTARNARATVCKRGHELPTERNHQGRRACRLCRSIREKSARVVGELPLLDIGQRLG